MSSNSPKKLGKWFQETYDVAFKGGHQEGPTLNQQLAKLPKPTDMDPPTRDQGVQAAVQDTLSKENRMRSASTILTSGAGLLDDPTTYSASRSLLGF